MCNLETEGTMFGCGHYVITRKLRKIDCNSDNCRHSRRHLNPCYNCEFHEQFLGPDAKETITGYNKEFCDECHMWYKNPGRR